MLGEINNFYLAKHFSQHKSGVGKEVRERKYLNVH